MNRDGLEPGDDRLAALGAAVERLTAELDRARAAEARYRNLLDNSLLGILIHIGGKLVYANAAFATMLAYDGPEEILALPSIFSVACPHERERLRGYIEKRPTGDAAPAIFRYQALARDGGRRVLEHRVRLVDWYGRQAFQCAVIDVTAEDQARAALARDHALLGAIIDTIPERLLVRDRDGKRLLANRARAELLGVSPAEFLRLPEKSPLLRPEDIPETERQDREVLDHGRSFEGRTLRRRPGGSEEWIHYHLVPLRGADGEISGTLSLSTDITEAKQAEEALRASEARFRDFAEIAADWLWETDAELRFSYVSPGFQGATGVPRERILGRTRREVYVEDQRDGSTTIEDREAFESLLDNMDAHCSFQDTEIVRLEADGRRLVFVASGKTVFDDDGSFLGYRGVTRDVSAQRNADAAVAHQAAELDALYRALPDLCFVLDANGAVLDFKPGADLTPYVKSEDFLGKRMRDVLPEPAATCLDAAVHDVASSGKPCTVEYALPYPDGDHHYEARLVALAGQRCFALVREITVRVRAEQELKSAAATVVDSEARFRDFAETAADWYWEMGPDLRFTYVGGSVFEEVMGYPPGDAIGHSREELFDPESNDGQSLAAHLRDLKAHRAFRNVELRWRNPRSGALAHVAINGKPRFAEDGAFLGYRGTARDVSTVRRAERQREQLKTQLAQAQKLEALGQLSGAIAHDFNNILGSILGYSSLAQQRYGSELPEPLGRYLDEIRHAGERARDVVAEILAYARGLPGERKTLSAATLIDNAAKLLRSTLPSSMPLEIRCADDLPALHVDAVQMDQVLLNLGVNARDAMGESGTLRIVAEAQRIRGATCASCKSAVDGEYLALRVGDRGPGIESEVLERIFEPFYTTKDQAAGTGMGLAIVHSVIHEHGGHVLVATGAETGTTFTLLLPPDSGALAPATLTPITAAAANPSATIDGALDGKRILVVDDDSSLLTYLGEFLQSAGCQPTLHTDPRAALAALRAAPEDYDLLLTDHTMPELTGAELATAVRAFHPGLPIIICTGYAQKTDALRGGAADAVITKPVDTRALLDTIARLLRR